MPNVSQNPTLTSVPPLDSGYGHVPKGPKNSQLVNIPPMQQGFGHDPVSWNGQTAIGLHNQPAMNIEAMGPYQTMQHYQIPMMPPLPFSQQSMGIWNPFGEQITGFQGIIPQLGSPVSQNMPHNGLLLNHSNNVPQDSTQRPQRQPRPRHQLAQIHVHLDRSQSIQQQHTRASLQPVQSQKRNRRNFEDEPGTPTPERYPKRMRQNGEKRENNSAPAHAPRGPRSHGPTIKGRGAEDRRHR